MEEGAWHLWAAGIYICHHKLRVLARMIAGTTRRVIMTAIRVAVELSGETQKEIARRIYTTPSHLCQSLTLKKGMSMEMMDAIMDELGLELVVTVRKRTR